MKPVETKRRYAFALVAFALLITAGSCKTSANAYAIKDEKTDMVIHEEPDLLNYSSIRSQKVPKYADRAESPTGVFFAPLLGSAVSLASNAVKQMIAKEEAKHMAEYKYALTDLYFYDQLSTESVFDPTGMQFKGFTLVRTFINNEGNTDTAFRAHFVLDTSNINEIVNNSIFRLKLEDLDLRYTKAKVTNAQKNILNMDIEISFNSSYVNDRGQLFDNVQLGKFYLLLRNMPLDKNQAGYEEYYRGLQNKALDGRSFIVPRSFGHYLAADRSPKVSYSQGAYSILVKVRESTLDKFVTKIIIDNSDEIIDALEGKAKSMLK